MNKAAKILFDYNDFTSFSKLHTDVKTNNYKILDAEWNQKNIQLIFKIKSDHFLRNMFRWIAGTLLEIESGKFSTDQQQKIYKIT